MNFGGLIKVRKYTEHNIIILFLNSAKMLSCPNSLLNPHSKQLMDLYMGLTNMKI